MQTNQKIKIGIIGGAGYTGGELIRILLHHPNVEISYVVSKSQAGKKLCTVHADLIGDTEMYFSLAADKDAEVVFLCLPHGDSKNYLLENNFLHHAKIIDLSRDFRINDKHFIYGLPELNKEKIKTSNYIANPGCFATAIQLGLLPLAEKGLLNSNVNVHATTGSTGAGKNSSTTSHFSWRQNNLSAYQVFEHAHIPEINQSLRQLQAGFNSEINFVPLRGSFTRGILATSILDCKLAIEDITSLYEAFYEKHPFVHIVQEADLKQVINTNKCFIQLIKHKDQLAVISMIDNLIKGASGQAVQNMNLLFDLEESSGLKLKASVY